MKTSIFLAAVICVAISSPTIVAVDVVPQPNPVCNCSCENYTIHEAEFDHLHNICHCRRCRIFCDCQPCGGAALTRRRRSIGEKGAPSEVSSTTTTEAAPSLVAENPLMHQRHICHCPMCKEPTNPTIPKWRTYRPFGLPISKKCFCHCPVLRCKCKAC